MNSPPLVIESDPLVFDKIVAPLEAALDRLDREPRSRAATKLGFRLFVRVLVFRVLAQIRSLRDLSTDLKTDSRARTLGLPALGLSTLHDAFARYPVGWFVTLWVHLAACLTIVSIPEVAALGQIWCVDGSLWPLVRQLGWLEHQGVLGVRLHLSLSLNTLCPAVFVLSYDKSPTVSERRTLLEMAREGVTYVLDRGYVKASVYLGLIARGASFIIRQKNNLNCRVLAPIEVVHHPMLRAVTGLTDSVVRLRRDTQGAIYRLVHFWVGPHEFYLLTNRWDLATYQVVMLYAWRWQVELIFRAWKHSLGALHWINLSETGIAIQFHILVMASMLWVAFEQEAARRGATRRATPARSTTAQPRPSTPTAALSRIFQVSWRLARPRLRLVRNCLSQSLSIYLRHRAELRL